MAKAIKLPAANSLPIKVKGVVAAPFVFLNPGGGEIYEVGTKIQIIWTGGPALPQNVLVELVNIRAWTVVNLNIPVTNPVNATPGICEVTIPHDFYQNYVASGKMLPTDTFQFYIQDTATTTWTYGPVFTIWCGSVDR